uniref:Uncharacterized protein n=1 Tax=Pteridomonas sp. YPF1301 TaxID=2766739 RepID=A0A7G1MNF4_9STRA|nr:hypothetical protein [Pteridomonas sp. YPF1301]
MKKIIIKFLRIKKIIIKKILIKFLRIKKKIMKKILIKFLRIKKKIMKKILIIDKILDHYELNVILQNIKVIITGITLYKKKYKTKLSIWIYIGDQSLGVLKGIINFRKNNNVKNYWISTKLLKKLAFIILTIITIFKCIEFYQRSSSEKITLSVLIPFYADLNLWYGKKQLYYFPKNDEKNLKNKKISILQQKGFADIMKLYIKKENIRTIKYNLTILQLLCLIINLLNLKNQI